MLLCYHAADAVFICAHDNQDSRGVRIAEVWAMAKEDQDTVGLSHRAGRLMVKAMALVGHRHA